MGSIWNWIFFRKLEIPSTNLILRMSLLWLILKR